MEMCICNSGKSFTKCCAKLLLENCKPRTATQLMRSRYAAYALGGYAEYLLSTWHPSTAASVSIAGLASMECHWKGLEIIESWQEKELAKVEFKAYYANDDGAVQVHHELSTFTREKGRWFYLDGDLY